MILSFFVLSKSAPRKGSKDMSTMKAVQVPHAGGAFELVERPLPEPQESQVRIKVEACGVCHSDSSVKEGGVYPITYPLSGSPSRVVGRHYCLDALPPKDK